MCVESFFSWHRAHLHSSDSLAARSGQWEVDGNNVEHFQAWLIKIFPVQSTMLSLSLPTGRRASGVVGTARTLQQSERACFSESPYGNLPTKHVQGTVKWARNKFYCIKTRRCISSLLLQLGYFVKIPHNLLSHLLSSQHQHRERVPVYLVSFLSPSTSSAFYLLSTCLFPSLPPSLTPMEIGLHSRSISHLFSSVKSSRCLHFPVTSSIFPYLFFSHLYSCIFDTYINV